VKSSKPLVNGNSQCHWTKEKKAYCRSYQQRSINHIGAVADIDPLPLLSKGTKDHMKTLNFF
jgi:hypothetical protein